MVDEVVQRFGDIVAQRVDRGADIEHQAILAVELDALGEVAGDRGLDDAADRRLELVGHPGERGLALGFGLLVLLGLGLGFALCFFRGLHLERLDRLGDVADLVLALETRQHHAEIAVSKLVHALCQRRDRIGHRARCEEGDHGADQQHQSAHGLLIENGGVDRGRDLGPGVIEILLHLIVQGLHLRLHLLDLRRDLVGVKIVGLMLDGDDALYGLAEVRHCGFERIGEQEHIVRGGGVDHRDASP